MATEVAPADADHDILESLGISTEPRRCSAPTCLGCRDPSIVWPRKSWWREYTNRASVHEGE